MGTKKVEEVAKAMNTCDAFVMVSERETFGVVYIEALAAGRPVIATKNGGANDLVSADNGILIDIDNKKQLMKAMWYMKDHIEEYNADIISNHCFEKFSSHAVSKRQIAEFRRIIEQNSE